MRPSALYEQARQRAAAAGRAARAGAEPVAARPGQSLATAGRPGLGGDGPGARHRPQDRRGGISKSEALYSRAELARVQQRFDLALAQYRAAETAAVAHRRPGPPVADPLRPGTRAGGERRRECCDRIARGGGAADRGRARPAAGAAVPFRVRRGQVRGLPRADAAAAATGQDRRTRSRPPSGCAPGASSSSSADARPFRSLPATGARGRVAEARSPAAAIARRTRTTTAPRRTPSEPSTAFRRNWRGPRRNTQTFLDDHARVHAPVGRGTRRAEHPAAPCGRRGAARVRRRIREPGRVRADIARDGR